MSKDNETNCKRSTWVYISNKSIIGYALLLAFYISNSILGLSILIMPSFFPEGTLLISLICYLAGVFVLFISFSQIGIGYKNFRQHLDEINAT